MRVIIQRVHQANVKVDNEIISEIGKGLLLLVGITQDDSETDVDYLAKKVLGLKLFPGEDNKEWKESVITIQGEILSVSQFTLYSKTSKGTKPDFHRALHSSQSKPIYDLFMERLKSGYDAEKVKNGAFGAFMDVGLNNDGPVTIILDSKDKLY